MRSTEHEKSQTVTSHTRIALALVVTMLAGVAAGAIEWGATRAQIDRLEREQWTVTDQLRFCDELQKQNPKVDVPIPDVEKQMSAAGMSLAMWQPPLTNNPEP